MGVETATPATLAMSQIRENPVALRQVNRKSEDYLRLVDSIKNKGVLNAISVRPMKDPETGEDYYAVVDGLHRYTAAMDAGLEEIPVVIRSLTDLETLEAQIIGNIHKVETTPAEYSRQLLRILGLNPTLTVKSLAAQLSRSETWLQQRLSLRNLSEKAAALVDEGAINLTNGFALAKLPAEEQDNYLVEAQHESPSEFCPKIETRKKQIDKDRRAGRDTSPAQFTPTPRIRSLAEVRDEYQGHKVGEDVVKDAGAKSAMEGFYAGLQWALRLDNKSVSEAKSKFDENLKRQSEKREEAAKARAEQRAKDARVRSDRLDIEAKHVKAGTDPSADLKAFDDKHGLVDGKRPVTKKEE